MNDWVLLIFEAFDEIEEVVGPFPSQKAAHDYAKNQVRGQLWAVKVMGKPIE